MQPPSFFAETHKLFTFSFGGFPEDMWNKTYNYFHLMKARVCEVYI